MRGPLTLSEVAGKISLRSRDKAESRGATEVETRFLYRLTIIIDLLRPKTPPSLFSNHFSKPTGFVYCERRFS